MVGKENWVGGKFSTLFIRKDTQGNFMKLLRQLLGNFFIPPAGIPNGISNSCQNQGNRHTNQCNKVCFSLEVPPIEKNNLWLSMFPMKQQHNRHGFSSVQNRNKKGKKFKKKNQKANHDKAKMDRGKSQGGQRNKPRVQLLGTSWIAVFPLQMQVCIGSFCHHISPQSVAIPW